MKKHKKGHIKTIHLKYQLQHGMKNLNYLLIHILYQIFKIMLNIYKKNIEKRLIILQSEYIYINKIENRPTFKFKTGY